MGDQCWEGLPMLPSSQWPALCHNWQCLVTVWEAGLQVPQAPKYCDSKWGDLVDWVAE